MDCRDDKVAQAYDFIYVFGFNFNYLLRNYKVSDSDMITKLCISIENEIVTS